MRFLTSPITCIGIRSIDSAQSQVEAARRAIETHSKNSTFAGQQKSKEFTAQQLKFWKLRPEQLNDLLSHGWTYAQLEMLGEKLERAAASVKSKLKHLDNPDMKAKARQAVEMAAPLFMENKMNLMEFESGFTRQSATLYSGRGRNKDFLGWDAFKAEYIAEKTKYQEKLKMTPDELESKYREFVESVEKQQMAMTVLYPWCEQFFEKAPSNGENLLALASRYGDSSDPGHPSLLKIMDGHAGEKRSKCDPDPPSLPKLMDGLACVSKKRSKRKISSSSSSSASSSTTPPRKSSKKSSSSFRTPTKASRVLTRESSSSTTPPRKSSKKSSTSFPPPAKASRVLTRENTEATLKADSSGDED